MTKRRGFDQDEQRDTLPDPGAEMRADGESEGRDMQSTLGGAKRAVIYLRVSTNDQVKTDYDVDGFSIRAQREACERKAAELGAVVVDEYIDRGESAKSADRPELQRMLKDLRAKGQIDAVIVHKVDRLARSREDDMAIVVAIRKAGAQLVSATENIDETPQGKLLHGIMATIAEFYSANLASEARKGMLQKAKSGGTITKAPLGYINTRERLDGGKEVRTVSIDTDRAHYIQWAFEAYASGNWSMIEIARTLNERGMRTRGVHGKRGTEVHKSHVEVILTNPYYTGVVTYEGVEYPGRHKPLVDRETYERVQDIRKSRALSREKIHKHPHYLKGSVMCGQCGDRLGVVNANGNGGVYPYFYCLGRAKRRKECTFRHVLIEEVERGVGKLWASIRLDECRIEEIRQTVDAQLERTFELSRKERARQERILAGLERQRGKAKEAYYADALSLEDFRTEQRRLNQQQEIAERIIGQCQLEIAELKDAVENALALFADASELYRQAQPTIRRQLNQAAFTQFRIHENGRATTELNEAFQMLLESPWQVASPPNQDSSKGASDTRMIFSRALEAVSEVSDELGKHENRVPLLAGHGSNVVNLVGPAGLEPATKRL